MGTMLCQSCEAIGISAEDFIITDGDDNDIREREYALGTLGQSRQRALSCPLCWLSLDATGIASSTHDEVQDDEDIQCSLFWEDDGFVTWSDKPTVRCLRVRMQRWPENFHGFNKITRLAQDEDDLFLGRRRSEGALNVSLLRKWIRTCLRQHGEVCGSLLPISHSDPLANLRVIDCWELRLVQRPSTARYLALSYVWGRVEVFRLTSSNCEKLERPAGLREIWGLIPGTIQDAIRVTSMIGERYLWIDSLCILQDDDVDKQKLVPKMSYIYDGALLTIVAANGDNANAGLPGASRSPIPRPQAIREVSPALHLLSQKSLSDLLAASVYESRGWT